MIRTPIARFVRTAVLLLAASLALDAQTAGADSYAYDPLGRLVRVDRTGGGTYYSYDAVGNRTEVNAVVECINSTCSGTNNVVFRIRNGAGAHSNYPFRCVGAWTMNTTGDIYSSTCATGWIALGCLVNMPTCPDAWSPPRTEYGCVDAFCEGENTIVWPVQNTNGQSTGNQKYLCTGKWWADTRGMNFDSSCTTGWTAYP